MGGALSRRARPSNEARVTENRKRVALTDLVNLPTQFALVFFRLAGLMVFAPLVGSARIPRQVKVMFAAVLTSVAPSAGVVPVTVGASSKRKEKR